MTILAFPSIIGPARLSWGLRSITQTHTSPFDGSTQTLVQPGDRWEGTLEWPTLSHADWRVLAAFLANLRGMSGRFTYAPGFARLAVGTGTVRINGAGQSGSTIDLDGWASGAEAFKAGDFFSYADTTGRQRLHMVTADVTADGSGVTNDVPITPPIRRAGADNALVEIASPSGVFRLADDRPVMDIRSPRFGGIAIGIVEALV